MKENGSRSFVLGQLNVLCFWFSSIIFKDSAFLGILLIILGFSLIFLNNKIIK